MDKVIEIKQDRINDGCRVCTQCPFSSSRGCLIGCGRFKHFSNSGGDYLVALPECPGAGKYRMTLERIEEKPLIFVPIDREEIIKRVVETEPIRTAIVPSILCSEATLKNLRRMINLTRTAYEKEWKDDELPSRILATPIIIDEETPLDTFVLTDVSAALRNNIVAHFVKYNYPFKIQTQEVVKP